MARHLFTRFVTLLVVSFAILFLSPPVFAVSNSIVAVDTAGTTGEYTSLALDAQGFPTISYYDATEGKLKVAHCFEKNCAFFNSILTPDAATSIGRYTSIVLDSNGKPVVSYYDEANSALKVLHCGNTTCSTGNTIATPDSVGIVGQYTAVTVDNKNFPVVSYYDATNGVLKVLHCGNAGCTAGNSIVKPDLNSSNGVQSSVKMNAAGNPVIAYFDFTHKSLKILTCGNTNCSVGNTIITADAASDVGRYPSLVFDSSGKPAVSYLDLTNGNLKVLRCGNATCSAGNTIAAISGNGIVGYFASLVLDASNNPAVSYYDKAKGKLNILRCGNATCTSGNTIIAPDAALGNVGLYTSLKLDANGNPVVSYFDASNGDLKVLHCGSATCNPNSAVVVDASSKVGRYSAIKIDANGNPIVSYWDETNGDLKLLHCGNPGCTANNTITSPYTTGNTGWDTSIALDANGNPVISFYDFTGGVMKVMHCNNATCSGANPVNTPDILSRRTTSIALDASGNPVIASAGQSDQGLRIVHCGNATCSANNTITSPDFPVFPAQADVRGISLMLDAAGNPVVSFYRADKAQLKILHCADANCSSASNTLTVVDPGAQASDHRSTSLTLDANGNPVVAYQDLAGQALKVLHCGNASCSAGNTIASPATGPNVGWQPSIKIDVATGRPNVSFGTANSMSVLYCGNAACTAGNVITAVDPTTTGSDSALTLDASGNPVASYYNVTGQNLKVLHCATKSCQ